MSGRCAMLAVERRAPVPPVLVVPDWRRERPSPSSQFVPVSPLNVPVRLASFVARGWFARGDQDRSSQVVDRRR